MSDPLAIFLNLCPECQHAGQCAGPRIRETPAGGLTCLDYAPTPAPREAIVSEAAIRALPDREPCAGCATRKGSEANSTHHTRADFDQCVRDRMAFLCHGDGAGRVCAGWLRAVKARLDVEDAEIADDP